MTNQITIEEMFDTLRAMKNNKKHELAREQKSANPNAVDIQRMEGEFAALDLAIRTLAAQFPTEASN